MRLGSLTLPSNLFLSPLAGYTNLPFRLVVRELGGVGLCTTDLVNARSLLEQRDKAFKLIETRPADQPLAVQIFGSKPEEMRDAAAVLEARGIAAVDVNMGCPVRKVCQVGGGSAMMTDLAKTAALVKGMVDAVKIPVTAKMRLGWDDQNITAPDLARALEDAGVAAVFVHGRTRQQGFGGRVSLDGIRQVVEAVQRIPVIGNGDVITPEAAKRMLEETGCAGVSIGRGAFYDPWIFRRTLAYLRTTGRDALPRVLADQLSPSQNPASHLPRPVTQERGEDRGEGNSEPERTSSPRPSPPLHGGEGDKPGASEVLSQPQQVGPTGPGGAGSSAEAGVVPPEPSFEERVRVMGRHLDLMVEVFGEEHGCRMFRKVAPWYARRFGPASEFNRRVVQISSPAQFREVLEHYLGWRRQFLDENGELKERFRPAPLVASFMQEPGAAPNQQIAVPKGPVELW